MSALPPKADIKSDDWHVRLVPKRTYALQQTLAYSITSSARASNLSGTVTPSAFAVWRLTMSLEHEAKECLDRAVIEESRTQPSKKY
jgi:hypothetical protein